MDMPEALLGEGGCEIVMSTFWECFCENNGSLLATGWRRGSPPACFGFMAGIRLGRDDS